MDRTKSKKRLLTNSGLGIIDKLLVCILGIALRRVFVHYLGNEISGLSGLFGNIIDFLNLAIAGFAITVYPKMYQYNAEDDYDNIRGMMKIIKRFYLAISLFIVFIGLLFSFFLDRMIYNNHYSIIYLQVVFLIQVITQCVRVMANPNQTLLSTRERGYIYITIDILINIVMYTLQIYAIIYTKNYIVYLLIALASYFIMNIALSIAVNMVFPWMNGNTCLGDVSFKILASDMKYTIFMKIADFIFGSTDSMVISKFLGLAMVNAYANYMTIATAVVAMFSSVEGAIKVYFGNKLAENSTSKEKKSFITNVTFIFYIMGVMCSTIYICLIGDFVKLWLGEGYVQEPSINILFGTYLFVSMIVCAPMEYLHNFGIFKREMLANVSSAIINLIVSLYLVDKIGIAGVLVGTLIGFIIRFIQRTQACFDNIEMSPTEYYCHMFGYVLVFILTISVAMLLCNAITIKNVFLCIILKGIVAMLVASLISGIVYSKTTRGKYIRLNLKNKKLR